MIGKSILHYKILEKLGEGGMGVVYKSEETRLERTVALKFLSQSLIGGEDEKKRFKREAKAAAALNHPNIAHVYAVDEVDGQAFIAMEYIDGNSLHELVGRKGGGRPCRWTTPSTTPPRYPPACRRPVKKASCIATSRAPTSW